MEILIAEHSGFCEGVERAFRIAQETVQHGQTVYMLGNLVHNKQVIDKLRAQGVRTVASLAEVPAGPDGLLLISAHGVAPEVYKEVKAKCLRVIDTTCPWVKKAQRIAKELADEGRLVIIVGDKGHAEVRGLVGWSGGKAQVVEGAEDLKGVRALSRQSRVGIVAQTTQAEDNFQRVVGAVKKLASDVKEFETICGATSKRQNAAVEIARQAELMLVIGDTMSANTKRLTELCAATGTVTHQIETVKQLQSEWLKGKTRIGVTAGASTPEWIVQAVLTSLRSAR